MQHVQHPDLLLQDPYVTIATYLWNIWNIHLQHREGEGRGRSISVVGVGSGGELRRASTTSTSNARECPWLGRGRPEAPRHVRPSGHGGVYDLPDDDGRRIDSERTSGVGDWDVGERCREQGRAARPVAGEGHSAATRQCAVGKRVDRWAATLLRGWADKHTREWGFIFFCFWERWSPHPRSRVRTRVTDKRLWWVIIENIN
jgi:hypothetical protein